MTSKAIRWAMHDVVLLTTSGLAAATGFYLGIEAAEERATVEFNALSKVEERLTSYRLSHGRYPVSSFSILEIPPLTVSDMADSR